MDERMPFQIPRRVDRHAHFDSMESFPRPTQQATPVALRRLTRDYQRLQQEPLPGIHALPCEENILEWHYCIEGSKDTPFYGGFYHGKVVFQPDFPWKPPSICMITPNGRFRINMRLCLSISDYHPEQWNPGWTVSSILLGLHSFMNEDGVAAGAITDSVEVRRELAAKSKEFNLANPEFCRMFPTLAMSFRTSSAQLDDSSSTPSSDRARSQSRKRKLCEEAKEPLEEEKKNDTPQAKGSFEEEKKPVAH